jgi:hypothetical protein
MKIKAKLKDNSNKYFSDVLSYKFLNCDDGVLEIHMNNPLNNCYVVNVKSVEQIKEETMNTFKKSDLKTGMMVQMSNGQWSLVLTSNEPYESEDLILVQFGGDEFMTGRYYDDNLDYTGSYPGIFMITKIASCSGFQIGTMKSFVNHSDPTAIPEFHIIWSRESDEKAKVISVIEGLQKELNDAKRKLEELG